jgi:hypothetical protein
MFLPAGLPRSRDASRMTFDDQLRRAFETLTGRLHDEISRQVQTLVDELAASAQAQRDQAVADAQAERDQEVAGAQAERDQAVAEAQAERDRAIADAKAERDQAVAAALEQQPVAVAAPEPPAPTEHGDDRAAPAQLLDAIRAIDGAHTLTGILDALVQSAAGEVGRAAVLLVRNGSYSSWRSIGFDPPFDRGQSVELPEGAPVMPIAIGGQAVAILYTETQNSELGTQNAENQSSEAQNAESSPNPALEILVRHAARCLESVTAFKAARAALANGGTNASGGGDEKSADEDAAARRYARLLVAEIRLYHESDVMAGRRDRDLGSRLGGEIARARVLYEQRVPAPIRQRADYFHDELVRTLADGDPALLELRT